MGDTNARIRVAALVADGFEQVELVEPMRALEQAGALVEIISLKPGQVQGFHHFDRGDKFPVAHTIDAVSAEDYDALLIPGGLHSPDQLRAERKVLEFVRAFDAAGKPIAAICHGPWVLVSAGLVCDRHMTGYPTIKDDLLNAGAEWSETAPVVDGNLITARSPDDLAVFIEAMLDLFGLDERQLLAA